jgi:hypothetical protein
MKLNPTFITLIIIFLSVNAFGQYTYKQKLGSMATIALPDTPKLKQIKGSEIYFAKYKGVFFMAEAGDIHGGLKDLITGTNADSIYNGYIKGTIESTKAKLFYKDKIKVNGHDGIEFGYKAELNGQQTYRYQHAVFLNDTLLMCGIWCSDSLSKDDHNLTLFFSGFKVKNAEDLSTARAKELGHKTGKAIAIIVALCIPLLLGLGVIFIIRKLVYKKDKS